MNGLVGFSINESISFYEVEQEQVISFCVSIEIGKSWLEKLLIKYS